LIQDICIGFCKVVEALQCHVLFGVSDDGQSPGDKHAP